jgi:hypothetical protein
VTHALSNAYFAEQGLLSLELRFREMHQTVAPAQMNLALE